jgi:hypothetical protein
MSMRLRPLGPAPLFDVLNSPELEPGARSGVQSELRPQLRPELQSEIQRAERDPGTGELTVLTSDADAVLRTLLAGGWSLTRAEPMVDVDPPETAEAGG